jgi:hypothetical protein
MKKLLLMLLLPIIILLSGCTKNIVDYKIDYHETDNGEERELIFSNHNELVEMIDDPDIEKYDDEFFDNKLLIVVFHNFGNGLGTNSFEINKIFYNNKTVYVDLNIESSGLHQVVVRYILYIEIPKIDVSKVSITKSLNQ